MFRKELIEIVTNALIDAAYELYLSSRSFGKIFSAQEPSCHNLHLRGAKYVLKQIYGVLCSCKVAIHRRHSLIFRPGSIPIGNHGKMFWIINCHFLYSVLYNI